MVAGFLIMGVLIRIVDSIAALRLYEGDWQGFMSWFLPSLSVLNIGGSFVEVFGTAAASLVLVAVINRLLTATLRSRIPRARVLRPGVENGVILVN